VINSGKEGLEKVVEVKKVWFNAQRQVRKKVRRQAGVDATDKGATTGFGGQKATSDRLFEGQRV
jgi:hypothetical protein